MAAESYPSDPITDVWRAIENNQSPTPLEMPHAASSTGVERFEVTAASIRSLRAYGLKSQKQVARSVERRSLARKGATGNHEDHAFKISG